MSWFQPTRTNATDYQVEEIQFHEQLNEVPGTNYILENEALKHADRNLKCTKDGIVLIPQPSDDPNDPLNWGRWRKTFFMVQAIFATFMICTLTAIFGIVVEGLESVGLDNNTISQGSGASFLLFGWFNVIFQPLSMSYGRRFLVLMMTLGCGVGGVVWNAYTKSSGNYYGCRIVQGILGAPVESLIEVLVADVFFEHERAYWMSLYGFALNGGTFFGPLAGAWIAQNMSWQWVFYFIAIFSGACGVVMLFFFDESGYVRPLPAIEGVQEAPAVVTNESGSDNKEKHIATETGSLPANAVEEGNFAVPQKLPYWKRMRLFTRLRPFPTFWQFMRPINVLWRFPHIQWAGWMVASSLCGFQVVTSTITLVFSAEPYNFGEGSIGLTYIGGAIGTIIGCLAAGPLNDWLTIRIAKSRGGRHEAEDRIYGTLPLVFTFTAGYILYGVGAAHGIHWIGPVFGLGILAFSMVCGAVIPYTYAVDAVGSSLCSDCIVAVILMRNTIGFAITYAINPWLTNLGTQNCFVSVAFIFGFLFWLTPAIMILWGKESRKRSAQTYYDWVAEYGPQ